MKCPKCQSDNPDTLKFCGECGTQLIPVNESSVSQTKTLETLVEQLTTGSTFAGRYEIVEELGKGGMGRVYRALDKELNEEVALKLIKPEIAAEEKTIERFKNELKLARRIRHKNVGGMYELMEEEGKPFITMEFVSGEDLKSLIRKKGKLAEGEAIAIAKQVCEGLAEAHDLGVIHRDLKPQNIMIGEKSNVKVMDFGIARSVEAPGVTQTGVMIGTPDYISPEQAEGEEADQRSDIYSLGVILYEMVTGAVPFKGDTALSVALKHKTQLPQDPKKLNAEISEELNRLILICMEKDRGRRYQTAEDLLVDLRNIEEGFPLGTKIKPRRETFVAALIRKKLFIPAVVVALAILISISVILINRQPSGKPVLPEYKQLTFTGNAHYPAISPDGNFIAYVDSKSVDEESVIIQDMVSGNTIEVFSAERCENLRWTRDSSEISFYSRLDKKPSTLIVPRLGGSPRILGGFNYFSWSPDDSQLAGAWVTAKKISLFNKTTGDIKSIPLSMPSTWFWDIDWSPSGGLILFLTSNKEGPRYTIWTVATDGSKQRKIVEDSVPLYSPRWSPRGDAIFYLRSKEQTRELWKIKVSPDTGEALESPSLVLSGLQAGEYFTISGDGRQLLYTREITYSNLRLASVERTGKDQTIETKQLTTGTLTEMTPSISPDGSRVAFSRGDGKTANIYIMSLDDGPPQQITFLDSFNVNPVWSPDGEEIAFHSMEGEDFKVWKVSVDGGRLHQFKESRVGANLAWSPGEKILYQAPGNRNIHVLDPISGKETPLTEDVGYIFSPKYSPDGKSVAVAWNRSSSHGLWIISLEDSSQVFLQEGMLWPIGWSTDGKWIYIQERVPGILKILMVGSDGSQKKTLISLPFTSEMGQPGIGIASIAPDGKRLVIPVFLTNSDVWVVENFDPDVK